MRQKTQLLKIKHYSLILVKKVFMKNLMLTCNSVLTELETVNTPYGKNGSKEWQRVHPILREKIY